MRGRYLVTAYSSFFGTLGDTMIKVVRGDCFSSENLLLWDAVGHQVNARGGFGTGFAAAVTRFSPQAREAYLRVHRTRGWGLGDIEPVLESEHGKWIVHICGQDRYGRGRRFTDYEALKRGLAAFSGFTAERGLRPALPRIGAGNAGGDWSIILPMIEEAFDGRRLILFEL